MKQGCHAFLFSLLIFSLFLSPDAYSYAVLSHQAIVDKTWDKSIKPLLKEKYPKATEEQLKEAHSYVYGGAITPDIGYYPFGSLLFTHLVHYVRTGDFIETLLQEADSLNEYAFALGVLCHYMADKDGHSLGTNVAVPVLFPKLQKEFGDTVNFEQARQEHMRVEAGFDVIQTVTGNYQPKAYHDFIGFKISESVLRRAFQKTYGLELDEVFGSLPMAESVFRFAVKTLIPELNKDAWKIRKSAINELNPLATKESYVYKLKRKDYKKEFGKGSIFSPIVSLILVVLPKIGPTAKFKFKAPDAKADKIFHESFRTIVDNYVSAIQKLRTGKLELKNVDLDTGKKTGPGEYGIADKVYADLLMKLKRKKFEHLTPGIKSNIIEYYNASTDRSTYHMSHRKWNKVNRTLEKLKATETDQKQVKK